MSSSQYINDSRGANARLALIEAGMDLFGEYGFKGATTRMIADQAEVNISAIAYYFGGKEELYYAVAEFILSEMVRHFNEFGSDWKKIIEEDISKKDAQKVLEQIIEDMAKLFVDRDDPRKWAMIIMREQANPTKAFDILYDGKIKKIQEILAKVISADTELKKNSDEVKVLAHTFYSQVLGFVVSRQSILRSLGANRFEKKHLKLIHKILQQNVQASLKAARKKKGGKND